MTQTIVQTSTKALDWHEEYRKGYDAGYTYGYRDGLRNLPPDARTPLEKWRDEIGNDVDTTFNPPE